MDAKQLRELVIRPVLKYLEPSIPYSEHAVELLMMTAAHETRLGAYIHQVKGPAEGIYQMEPVTEEDILMSFLKYRPGLETKVRTLLPLDSPIPDLYGLAYSTAMARIHYFRDKEPLPSGNLHDFETAVALADYAKRVFNTHKGKATADDYLTAYLKLGL